jgi:hypothetical protein
MVWLAVPPAAVVARAATVGRLFLNKKDRQWNGFAPIFSAPDLLVHGVEVCHLVDIRYSATEKHFLERSTLDKAEVVTVAQNDKRRLAHRVLQLWLH